MEKVFAFVDESGDPRFNPGASDRLEFSAVLVDEQNHSDLVTGLEELQVRLGVTELKSSSVRSERRRLQILESLAPLNFRFINLSIDKSKVYGTWKNHPNTFYKYSQKLLHRELHRLFEDRSVTIDKFGTEQYQVSLKNYLERDLQLSLFGEVINVGTAKSNLIIQLADFVAGTHRKLKSKDFERAEEIEKALNKHILHILYWPDDFGRFFLENLSNSQDRKIADISVNYAERYIREHRDNLEYGDKIKILEYLLFQVKFQDSRAYIYTNELIDWLKELGLNYSDEEFRKEVLGSLRDDGVVIAGSRRGLKIPISEAELIDYINYTSGRYLTMMRRLRETFRTLNASALGDLSLFKTTQFEIHKKFFDVLDEDI